MPGSVKTQKQQAERAQQQAAIWDSYRFTPPPSPSCVGDPYSQSANLIFRRPGALHRGESYSTWSGAGISFPIFPWWTLRQSGPYPARAAR